MLSLTTDKSVDDFMAYTAFQNDDTHINNIFLFCMIFRIFSAKLFVIYIYIHRITVRCFSCTVQEIIKHSRNISESLQNISANAVEVSEIEYRDISNHINVSGNVESENLVKITSKLNAKVKIILDEKKNVLAVPYDSVITDGDGNSHILLAVKESDGITKVKYVSVEKGMEGTYYTEIISPEIREEDNIIMNPDNYKDGDILPVTYSGAKRENGVYADE